MPPSEFSLFVVAPNTTVPELFDAPEEPAAFFAITLKEYDIPLAMPVTTHELLEAPDFATTREQDMPAFCTAVATKDVAAALLFGRAFHDTVIFSPLSEATTPVGTFGTGAGLIAAEAREVTGLPFTGVPTTTNE